jgi:hypothetical protein
MNRSTSLENVCLADYASKFNYKSTDSNIQKDTKKTSKTSSVNVFPQTDGKGFVKSRQFAKIIRSRRYSPTKEPFMYHREQLMLYHPWPIEEQDMNMNPMPLFVLHSEAIKTKAAEYNYTFNNADLEEMIQTVCEAEDNVIAWKTKMRKIMV